MIGFRCLLCGEEFIGSREPVATAEGFFHLRLVHHIGDGRRRLLLAPLDGAAVRAVKEHEAANSRLRAVLRGVLDFLFVAVCLVALVVFTWFVA